MSVLRRLGNGAQRGAAALASAGSEGRRLLILHYHRVPERADPMCPELLERDVFALHMRVLHEVCNVLPLSAALDGLDEGRLPARAVAITFDDGYADNFQVALPVLQHFGLPAAFFIAAGFLDGGAMFNDLVIEACRVAPAGVWRTGVAAVGDVVIGDDAGRPQVAGALIARLKYLDGDVRMAAARTLLESAGARFPAHLMMSGDELRRLHRAGMEIGGHTLNHPILARLDAAAATREVREGQRVLEGLLGHRPVLFAYPNGRPGEDYGPREVAIVREAGFSHALTTRWACAMRGVDPWQVPRIGSWDRTAARFCARLLRAWRQPPSA